ncbi:MAG TPA: protein kinase [Steroidobacteraceae bacterium]|jgi:DNA-binding response OmpR family regulator|nr:protein kinase [Steroidobacteraceae bacterium]
MNARLLIVDRDAHYREWLRNHLGVLFPDGMVTAMDEREFETRLESFTRQEFHLIMFVAHFGYSPEDPHSEGLERLRLLRDRPDFPAVMAVAEDGNELTAVRALQLGAIDYLPKRLVNPDRLRTAVKLALRRVELDTPQPAEPAEEASDAADAARSLRDPIPGYSIRKTIGESEKAMVYLAGSEKRAEDVALKVTKSEVEEADNQQALAREYAALSALNNPSIVSIYDYGTNAGREFLAMEYFPRGDLKGRLLRGILEADALRYLEQIARGLQVVHEAGILHRDLKPPNLMLRENDTLVLIDFGLARSVEGAPNSTRTGVLRGSPYYMSPEQALGEDLDGRTDLYSLGILFYEMVTGRKPYTGLSAIDVLQQHVTAPVPQLPHSHVHLQALLEGLIAKSRDDRFANAAQAIEAIAGMRALRRTGSRR